MSRFVKAVRSQRKLRAAFDGPAGAGKTFSALRLAFSLVDAGLGKSVAIIDTENNSASLYAGEAPDGRPWDFATLALKQFGPDQFTFALNEAVKEGFDVVVVDSLSHAWVGEGGALDMVDQKGGNRFSAWKDITPLQRRMMDTIIRCPAHVIATMRSKTEYVLEDDERGKKVPRKIGMAPVQRDGVEFEFDVYGSMDWSHQLKITKTRCHMLDNMTAIKPGPAFWGPLFDWLKSAAPSTNVVPDPIPELASPPPPFVPKANVNFSTERFVELKDAIEHCTSEIELNKIAAVVSASLISKHIDQDQRRVLADQYRDCLKKIKSQPPTAPASAVEKPAEVSDDTKSPQPA